MWTNVAVVVLLIGCVLVLAFIGLCIDALVGHVRAERSHKP